MRKTIVVAGVAVFGWMAGAGSAAWADQPVLQACVGTSISAGAQQPGPFGQFVTGVAHTDDAPGVGDAVHALAAGDVADSDFPNTCNG